MKGEDPMDGKHINWCTCEDHDGKDWTVVADFYARHFLPKAWVFEYHTTACHESGRVLYMAGNCNRCGGFMRSGTSVPANITGDELLAYVYREMTHFRPYDGYDEKTGVYHGHVRQRAEWYQQQDDLTLEGRNEQFLRLFRETDRSVVNDWLARTHGKEPACCPRRDRKSVLFQRVLEAARADGAIAEAEAILDYTLPSVNEPLFPEENGYLTDYRFDFVPRLSFGSEGIYLELYLEGSFDGTDRHSTGICTFKTLRSDAEACRLMGALGGALMYHGREYVSAEIRRYTPAPELKRMAKGERSDL